MDYAGQILALDLAARTGWALGRPGDVPRSGSVAVAPAGSSLGRVFCGCRGWLGEFLIEHPTAQLIVFESPLLPHHMRGKTNIKTIRQLIGLASVVEELLYTLTGYDIREARVADVRTHFLGSNKHKREEAKALTMQRCRLLGWNVVDDNAADALALWDYQVSLLRSQWLR